MQSSSSDRLPPQSPCPGRSSWSPCAEQTWKQQNKEYDEMEGTDEIVKPPGQDHLIFDWQSASHVLPKVPPRRVGLKHAVQGNWEISPSKKNVKKEPK